MTRILKSARPLGGAARPAPLSPAGSTAAAQASTARDDAQLPSIRQRSCDTSMNAPLSGIVQICIVIGMQDDGI
jgi:hypothetical protein